MIYPNVNSELKRMICPQVCPKINLEDNSHTVYDLGSIHTSAHEFSPLTVRVSVYSKFGKTCLLEYLKMNSVDGAFHILIKRTNHINLIYPQLESEGIP
jgi:hypothetical protein